MVAHFAVNEGGIGSNPIICVECFKRNHSSMGECMAEDHMNPVRFRVIPYGPIVLTEVLRICNAKMLVQLRLGPCGTGVNGQHISLPRRRSLFDSGVPHER